MVIVTGAMVAAMLLVWPLAIRRFARDRELVGLGGGGALRARSPDRGLPALGWFLLALGVYSLAAGLGSLPLADDLQARAAEGGRGDNPLAALGGMFGNTAGSSEWLTIGVAALQTWAGLELVRMTPRYKNAGMAYGLAAAGIALSSYLPILDDVSRQSAGIAGNPLGIMAFATVATSLVIPVATVILVQRKLVDPDAIADAFT